jgi:hypothetical protein
MWAPHHVYSCLMLLTQPLPHNAGCPPASPLMCFIWHAPTQPNPTMRHPTLHTPSAVGARA